MEMSHVTHEPKDAIERLSRRDPTLKRIYLWYTQHSDTQLAELADSLLANPDVVTDIFLNNIRLTDATGVKLARYVAASSTIKCLNLSHNQLGDAAYLALAAALRVNSSLKVLSLWDNQAEDKSCIDAAFVSALRVNPIRPVDSEWKLYSYKHEFPPTNLVPERYLTPHDLYRLQDEAKELGHPSLQLLLCAQLDHFTFQNTRHFF
jgi:hypothetical protein